MFNNFMNYPHGEKRVGPVGSLKSFPTSVLSPAGSQNRNLKSYTVNMLNTRLAYSIRVHTSVLAQQICKGDHLTHDGDPLVLTCMLPCICESVNSRRQQTPRAPCLCFPSCERESHCSFEAFKTMLGGLRRRMLVLCACSSGFLWGLWISLAERQGNLYH